jgi:hypothetical protein
VKFGVYRDRKHFTELQATTIDEAKAKRIAADLAGEFGGSYSVVILGVQTPGRIEYRDHFAPKMIYKVSQN